MSEARGGEKRPERSEDDRAVRAERGKNIASDTVSAPWRRPRSPPGIGKRADARTREPSRVRNDAPGEQWAAPSKARRWPQAPAGRGCEVRPRAPSAGDSRPGRAVARPVWSPGRVGPSRSSWNLPPTVLAFLPPVSYDRGSATRSGWS